jgi:hypothetical protein
MSGFKADFYPFAERPDADSCWSLHAGPDGRIYAASCIEHVGGKSATLVRYDEAGDRLEYLFDLDEVTGDLRDSGRATQCKIHYSFAPASDGTLYMATHLSGPPPGEKYYNGWAGWHDAVRSFRGAYLVAYDTRTDSILSSELMIPKEGCRCLCLDEARRRLYAITYPRDHFVIWDLESRRLRDRGRIGSVNTQCLFTDRTGRVHLTDDRGHFLRYDPDQDSFEDLQLVYAHEGHQTGWHGVLYDAVADPSGEAVYLLPWGVRPHLMRYFPHEGRRGRLEDLGPVTQDRDERWPISMSLDHAGGLVFGTDRMLYYVRARWPDAWTRGGDFRNDPAVEGVLTRMDPQSLETEEVCVFARGGSASGYATRGARDAAGSLYFGHVGAPPVGLFRVTVPGASRTEGHLPLRTWG